MISRVLALSTLAARTTRRFGLAMAGTRKMSRALRRSPVSEMKLDVGENMPAERRCPAAKKASRRMPLSLMINI